MDTTADSTSGAPRPDSLEGTDDLDPRGTDGGGPGMTAASGATGDGVDADLAQDLAQDLADADGDLGESDPDESDPADSDPAEGDPVDSGSADGGSADGEEADADGVAGSRGRTKQNLLDQEGDAAADYLEELLDIADLDGDIDIFVENGRASVAVLADATDPTGLQVLVGRDGEVLDALQELTRLAAQARTGERSRLLLDIAGWRDQRRTTAAKIAGDVIDRVRRDGASIELEPMPAYQRKAVHDAVAEAGLRSESDGAEPHRFVVVHPA